jgi:hypothetical protein
MNKWTNWTYWCNRHIVLFSIPRTYWDTGPPGTYWCKQVKIVVLRTPQDPRDKLGPLDPLRQVKRSAVQDPQDPLETRNQPIGPTGATGEDSVAPGPQDLLRYWTNWPTGANRYTKATRPQEHWEHGLNHPDLLWCNRWRVCRSQPVA